MAYCHRGWMLTKIEAVGKRDMGVLLLSLLAKKEAGLELGELGLKSTEDMGE